MKKLTAFAAAGLLAASVVSTGALAECAGHDKVVQTDVPTISTAPSQTASTETKTTKPGS